MDPSNIEKQDKPEEPRFLKFPHLPDDAVTAEGVPRLNRYSSILTKDHDFPGAQVCISSISESHRNDFEYRRCSTLPESRIGKL